MKITKEQLKALIKEIYDNDRSFQEIKINKIISDLESFYKLAEEQNLDYDTLREIFKVIMKLKMIRTRI